MQAFKTKYATIGVGKLFINCVVATVALLIINVADQYLCHPQKKKKKISTFAALLITDPVIHVLVGICWDQWFPETARAMVLQGAEILFYPTAIGSEPQDMNLDSREHWKRVMQGHAGANLVLLVFFLYSIMDSYLLS